MMVLDPELAPEVQALLEVERSVLRVSAATRNRALARAREVVIAAAPVPPQTTHDQTRTGRTGRVLTVVVGVLGAAVGATAGYLASSYVVSKLLTTASTAPSVVRRADRPYLP